MFVYNYYCVDFSRKTFFIVIIGKFRTIYAIFKMSLKRTHMEDPGILCKMSKTSRSNSRQKVLYSWVLNIDVLLEIFSYLDASEVYRMQQVSPQFLHISKTALRHLKVLNLDRIYEEHGITADSFTIKMILMESSGSIRRVKLSRASFKNHQFNTKIDEENLKTILARCSSLEHLHIENIQLHEYLENFIVLAPKLKTLVLIDCAMSGRISGCLERACQLEVLDLGSRSYYTKNVLSAIAGLTKLKDLTVKCDSHTMTMAMLECLTFRDILVYLDITVLSNYISESIQVWQYLKELSKLKFLKVSILSVTDDDILRLNCKSSLKKFKLQVRFLNLTTDCISKFVRECRSLRLFDICTNKRYTRVLTDLFHQNFRD